MIAPIVPVHPYMGIDYVLESFFVLIVGGLGRHSGTCLRRRDHWRCAKHPVRHCQSNFRLFIYINNRNILSLAKTKWYIFSLVV